MFAPALAILALSVPPCGTSMRLEPRQATAMPGDVVLVDLVAYGGCGFNACDWTIVYDPAECEIVGQESALDWFWSGWLPDPDGFNAATGDGVQVWTGLVPPGVEWEAVGVVATIEVQIGADADGDVGIMLPKQFGQWAHSRFLDAGYDVTRRTIGCKIAIDTDG